MKDIFSFLKQVRTRPGMFLGHEEAQRREQLSDLESIFYGYQVALETHDINEPGRAFCKDLSSYLRETRGWSTELGPVAAILLHSASPEDAWRDFWELIDEFQQARYPDRIPDEQSERDLVSTTGGTAK